MRPHLQIGNNLHTFHCPISGATVTLESYNNFNFNVAVLNRGKIIRAAVTAATNIELRDRVKLLLEATIMQS